MGFSKKIFVVAAILLIETACINAALDNSEHINAVGTFIKAVKSGTYTYKCYINFIGTDETPPAELLVYKGNEVIVNQPAKVLKQLK